MLIMFQVYVVISIFLNYEYLVKVDPSVTHSHSHIRTSPIRTFALLPNICVALAAERDSSHPEAFSSA